MCAGVVSPLAVGLSELGILSDCVSITLHAIQKTGQKILQRKQGKCGELLLGSSQLWVGVEKTALRAGLGAVTRPSHREESASLDNECGVPFQSLKFYLGSTLSNVILGQLPNLYEPHLKKKIC